MPKTADHRNHAAAVSASVPVAVTAGARRPARAADACSSAARLVQGTTPSIWTGSPAPSETFKVTTSAR